jgi:hypothetical protein
LIAPAPTALALLALAGCGAATKTVTVGGPPKGFTAAATLPAASKTTADAGAPIRVLHLANFRSPTGNIGCLLLPDDARCDIERRGWSPPQRPANCPAIVDFGQGLQMGATGAPSFVCAGDTVRELTAPGLGYGEASRVGPFECLSRSSGMTCTRRSDGHGFFLSIQSYRIF